eukprot:TRINITY_DN11684_c0_g1_i1.p1 TRINITY_DN11684_c0_g1~~TRINITY_DN11684_c0_g1_i1.p1  ORF type:complete len:329 (+),score=157.21 TRINITY_DN11684_c0_g1_i1:102-1088(+)
MAAPPEQIPGLTEPLLSPAARPQLLEQLRQCVLKHDELGQEILLNAMLQNLLHHKLVAQADKLIANGRPDPSAPFRSANQAARFCFYKGYVKAVQLDYTEANNLLQQALRKAPERALGFRTIATKMWLIVQLLMGEIPPRSEFMQKDLKVALAPYLKLTGYVRFGHVGRFTKFVQHKAELFASDRTYMLIQRIRHNVIKTALRRISLSYSRISIVDIRAKLDLQNPEDAEYIVQKAIHDGVIDAKIDHDRGLVLSTDLGDVYASAEPVAALQKRISYCITVNNDAVQAMRYPDALAEDEDEADLRKKREEDERELEKLLEEEDDDMFD